jgi:hypothetical protein
VLRGALSVALCVEGALGPQMFGADGGRPAKLGKSGPRMLGADSADGVGAGAVAGAANAAGETNPPGTADFGVEEVSEAAVIELVATLPDQHATLREELLLAFRAHLGRRRAAGSPSSTPHLAGGPRPTDATGLELRAADAGALPAARQRRSERDLRVGVVRP